MFWFTTILFKISYQQILFYSAFTDTTLTDIDNWSFIGTDPLNVFQFCGPDSIVGGFQKFGVGIAATKFLLLDPHYKMKISFTLFIIDTWDPNEYYHVYVDENLEFHQTYNFYEGQAYICGQIGNHRQDSIHEISFEFQHTGSTTFIELTSTLDQDAFDESWGYRNFRLFLYLCPTGCLTCSQSNSQVECQTWIIVASFYIDNVFTTDGWNILNGDLTKQQCSMIPSICGYGVCGKNTKLILTLVSLPFHTRMKIKLKYLKIDGWDNNDYSILQINQNIKWKQSLSELDQYLYGVCGGSQKDIFVNVELTFPHLFTSTQIIISNTLDQNHNIESFGVRDIQIFVQQSICGDTIVQEYEECDDGNMDPFDGCFNCLYSCIDGCSLCHQGTCLGCYSGWQYLRYTSTCQRVFEVEFIKLIDIFIQPFCYIEGCLDCVNDICILCSNGYHLNLEYNICQSICGDNLITINEECDGLLNCNQCQFNCPNYCNQCEFGICLLCQQDYILQNNNQCIKYEMVSLCQSQCEICVDSVCYKCQYGQQLVLGQCLEICRNNILAMYQFDECICNPYCSDCRFGFCYQCAKPYFLINNTCISNKCGDLIIQEDEECDDGNEIEFDGCYNCQFSCSLDCQECQYGKCIDSCQYGYYFINNKCTTICGDQIIAGNEECEDNDGCYQCQYSCPINCNNCQSGQCQICNPGFILINNMCTSICGDGILSNLEQCDDGNQNDGDGCTFNCLIEINWICKLGRDCNYVKYPTIITEYLMQKNQYQYVNIAFSQPVLKQSNINYLENIKASIVDLNETLFNITIMEVQPALINQVSEVQYILQIEIFKNLDYYPILEIILTEQLYNNNLAPLIYMKEYLQLKQSNYINQEQIQMARTFQYINEISIKSLCLLSILPMLLGNALSFWFILDALQEQSYLKYINVLYPQTLIIYFQSSQVISVNEILDIISQYKNQGRLLKFPYLQAYEKFEFYEVNADIAEGFRAEIIVFATLYLVYISTLFFVKILSKLESSEFLLEWPKLVRYIQKMKRKVYKKVKETKMYALKNTLRACAWDLIFMSLLELNTDHDFTYSRTWICILIATLILVITIILLLNQVTGLKSWQKQNFNQFWSHKRDIFQVTKKFLILYILIFYQYEQELQTLILTLINVFYLIYTINFKYVDYDNLEYAKVIVMETSTTIFTASTFVNWNILSSYLLYTQKITISWLQMSVLLSVLIFFIFIELYNTYSIVKQKIITSRTKSNLKLQEIQNVDPNSKFQNSKIFQKNNKTIFQRAQYPRKF
ncbi:unnamed protein product [Paramecium primaurelia]|uniref:Insulin-like growth factor binding protein, N-terminal n=1 Tax=Paramecium primaurelia TaxID=5886 RepID=A0A8S1Q0Y5_PARPR|nr:unnamed protein product [Paramecium primaurelia]